MKKKYEEEKGREEMRGEKKREREKKEISAARRYARKRARVSLTKICRYFRILVCR